MKILKIIVDDVPQSCGDCRFCETNYDNTGYCKALEDEQVSTLQWCVHKSCLLVTESEVK